MWKDSTKLCKAEKDGYLSGDLPTNDADQACNLINGFASGPSWLGIVKEKYISVYKGTENCYAKIKRFFKNV